MIIHYSALGEYFDSLRNIHLSWYMSRRGICYAYSIICARLCSHSPEFEILIGLTWMDFNPSSVSIRLSDRWRNSRTFLVVPHWLTRFQWAWPRLLQRAPSGGSIITMTGKVANARVLPPSVPECPRWNYEGPLAVDQIYLDKSLWYLIRLLNLQKGIQLSYYQIGWTYFSLLAL